MAAGWRVMMYGHRGYSYLLSYSNTVAATELIAILSSSFLFTNAADMVLEIAMSFYQNVYQTPFLGGKMAGSQFNETFLHSPKTCKLG